MKSKVLTGNRDRSLTPQKGFDYKWIEFWPQKGQGIAKYPGVSAWSREDLTDFVNQNAYGEKAKQDTVHLKDVYDVIVAMGKVVKKIYKKMKVLIRLIMEKMELQLRKTTRENM